MTTAQDQQSREAYEDGKWYWVEHDGWGHNPPIIAPARYRADCDSWYSFDFSGITTRYIKVLEPCVRQAARALPAGIKPVGYLIDWPDEPDLGHYFAEGASTTGRSQPLHTAAQVLAMGSVPVVPVPQSIEQMAVDRYKVVPSHNSMFYPCAVVAGDGQQQLYIGREVECQNMARKFTGAFLDGAFVALTAAAPRPPAAQEAATGPCGQCKDARQPCQCSLDTILKERGLVAVNRESFQHMVTKIAAASAPACWCAACDSAASPFGIPTRMSLCPKCGDKRCPRAYHHDSDCFASPKEPAP